MDATRTIVIGDVHGCIRELKELLQMCEYEEGKDKLIFVGDLVGKGPESINVINYVRKLSNVVVIRGNHDQFVIDCKFEYKKTGTGN